MECWLGVKRGHGQCQGKLARATTEVLEVTSIGRHGHGRRKICF